MVRTLAGEVIAYGELVQKPTRGLITSHLLLYCTDGSLSDETVTFSQKEVFRLESYRLVHRGPSFPQADIAFDRKSGQCRVRQQDKPESEEKTARGRLEMPPDLYNGMASTLMKICRGVPVPPSSASPLPRNRACSRWH
jgi:hypothetical protein